MLYTNIIMLSDPTCKTKINSDGAAKGNPEMAEVGANSEMNKGGGLWVQREI